MTLEEKAEDWWNNWVVKDWNDLQEGKRLFIQAFLAGLKAGRPQWHDLRKDPNDLPDDYRSVWTNQGGAYYDIESKSWNDGSRWVNDVTAWCEPQFKE